MQLEKMPSIIIFRKSLLKSQWFSANSLCNCFKEENRGHKEPPRAPEKLHFH